MRKSIVLHPVSFFFFFLHDFFFFFLLAVPFRVWQLAKAPIGMRPALFVGSFLACTRVCYIILLFGFCCFCFCLFACIFGKKRKWVRADLCLFVFNSFTRGVRCCLYRPKYSIQLTLKMQNKKIQACPRLWSIVTKGMRLDGSTL